MNIVDNHILELRPFCEVISSACRHQPACMMNLENKVQCQSIFKTQDDKGKYPKAINITIN